LFKLTLKYFFKFEIFSKFVYKRGGFVQCSQGKGGLSSTDIFQTRGVFQMRTSALFSGKNFGFFEIYGVSALTGREGVEPVRTFCGQKGRESIFLQFCADVFYGRHLMQNYVEKKNRTKKSRKSIINFFFLRKTNQKNT